MGAVVLVITGAEALYADMGHFGRPPILRGWFFVVFPALTLNYLGQASLILRAPGRRRRARSSCSIPHWARLPMVRAGHRGHGDRQPGRHLRRLLAVAGRPCSSACCRR